MTRRLLSYIFIVLGWSALLTLTNLIIIFEGYRLPIPKDLGIVLMLIITNLLSGLVVADVKKTIVCYMASVALMLIITYEILYLPYLIRIIPKEFGELLSMASILNIRKGIFLILPLALFGSLIGSLLGEHTLKV